MKARSAAVTGVGGQHGAASVEFSLIVFLVMIPLFLGMIQLALFMVAKNTVNMATLNAARAGAASGMNQNEMRNAFLIGILPLYASSGMRSVNNGAQFADVSNNYTTVMAGASFDAVRNWGLSPVGNYIQILNPVASSFADFGVVRASDRQRVIPVENLMSNNTVGATSRQLRSDALLLKIETSFCFQLAVPVVDEIVVGILRRGLAGIDLEKQDCYRRNAVPIRSQAVVRMTVPPLRTNLR